MPTITPPTIDTIVTIGVGEVTQTRHRLAHLQLRQDGVLRRKRWCAKRSLAFLVGWKSPPGKV